jgi:hypothetical protein
MDCPERLAVPPAGSRHFHDPTGAAPGRADVLRCCLGLQRPRDLTAVADLVIRCCERDVPLALELSSDLTMLRPLVALDGQEDVGPLLCELAKNA